MGPIPLLSLCHFFCCYMKALAHNSALFLSAQNEGKILRIHLRILKVSSWEWLSLCPCSQPRMATNIQEVSRKVWSIRLKQQWEQTCQRDHQSLVSQFQPSLWWFKMSPTGTVVKFSADPIIIYKGVCVGQRPCVSPSCVWIFLTCEMRVNTYFKGWCEDLRSPCKALDTQIDTAL